jgi:Flp pilus assembly protein TadD
MPSPDDGYSFVISVADFDKTVLPTHARTPGTDEFSHEVSQFFQKEFAAFKGRAEIVVDPANIEVSWQSDPKQPHPVELVKRKLERGQFAEAIELLEKLRRYQPNDDAVLCILGMALSDTGQLDKAEQILRHAVNVAPDHVNARIALGVVLARKGRHAEAIPFLREAVAQESSNPWAYRNLGACLLTLGQIADAETSLRRAVELNPVDQQSLFGLAHVLQVKGEPKEADDLYIKIIALDETSSTAENARKERTKLSQQSFRAAMPAGIERPDAVMYCLSALQTFDKMKPEEVKKIGFEIALLGQKGLATNEAAEKYRLKSLPGKFSGLHLVCLMYVAFQKVAPEHDLGFDLAKEYDIARTMHKKGETE